ncbi:SDR family oxidoreductase [Actinocorallia sp. B10E7]|uniref:SDR family NAD(P)-dependent oxidoreductase n=1 Tax=Actinocorallia sp. B10E7 TaxID=3153558 RepID=UPI00325E684B
MDLGLEGKVALIAGGSSGLGLASARELAQEGMHVAVGSRDPAKLADAARSIKEVSRGKVHTTSVDLTDRAAVERWVAEVADEFGALHVVLVCGGSPPVGGSADFTVEDYDAAVDLVLLPAVHLALTTLPHLRAAGWGRLLFVASETASSPSTRLALSGVTRAGLVRFAQSLACQTGRDGITVNVLAPATTRTPPIERVAARIAEDGDVEAALRAMGEHNPLGRIAEPEEFAALVAFLAGTRASFITGGVHPVDGGAGAVGTELPYLDNVSKNILT